MQAWDAMGVMRQQNETLLAPLQAPNRAVLLLWHGAVVGQQVLVPQTALTESEVVLGLQDGDTLRSVHLLRSEQWQTAPREGRCRVLDLTQSQVLHGHSPPPSLSTSRSLGSLRASLLSSAPQPLQLQMEPLWPHRRLPVQVPRDTLRLQTWLAALVDSTLLKNPLQATPSLRTKWLRWLDARLSTQSQCAHVVALALACHWSPQPTRYGKPDWPWAREWIQFQLQLFVATLPEPATLAQDLRSHVAWTQQCRRDWHHPWSLYLIEQDCLWLTELDEQGLERFTLSARWLPLLDHRPSVKRGRLSVDRLVFDSKVAPCLYRLVLQDYLYETRWQAVRHGEFDTALCDDAWSHERDWLNGATVLCNTLRDCATWEQRWQWLGDTQTQDSPVQRSVVKWLEKREDVLTNGSTEKVTIRIADYVTDIEDLAKLAPPCLKRGLEKDWCQHWDRFNLVGYLWDAGYSQQQVTEYVLRNKPDSRSDRGEVESRYRECERSNPSWGRVSSSCGTLMNARFENAHIRCVYEEQYNEGKRRANHTKTEKQAFCDQCVRAARLDTVVYHPLDFVEARLKQARET